MTTAATGWPADVERARTLVMRHGWNATCYQIVNPGIQHWFSDRADAVVGYASHSGIRVVAGAPICHVDHLSSVVEEFESYCRTKGDGVCYFGAEARLESVLAGSSAHSKALLGSQPAWDPALWSDIIRRHTSLRAQLHRAANKGVSIVELSPAEASQSSDLRDVLSVWLKSRKLPPLHFLVEPETLSRLEDRRIFVANVGNAVAFAVASPIPARKGWLIEQFPRLSSAPNGTIELLISKVVEAVGNSGARYVTLGLAPLARRSEAILSGEPAWLKALLSAAAAHGERFYNFGGLEAFKAKFHPAAWEPVYAIQAAHRFSPKALYAIAGAFASRSPLTLVASAVANAAIDNIRR